MSKILVEKSVIQDALAEITEMHQGQMSAWTGPMEIQRQLLLALGKSDKECEDWSRKHYG